MGFLKRLKKVVRKAAKIYGQVGIGPGSGIALKASQFLDAREAMRARRPGESGDSMGHNRRAMLRAQGISHGQAKLAMIQSRIPIALSSMSMRRAPTRRRSRTRRRYAGRFHLPRRLARVG